jgi:hypothetical protein
MAVVAAPDRDEAYLFGGYSGAYLDDTWVFNGRSWRQLALPAGPRPPARAFAAATYDLARGRAVLFGGDGSTGILGDTWEFDGAQWVQVTTATRPSARTQSAMAYHETEGVAYLFGGTTTGGSNGWRSDLWAYDGTSWTQISRPGAPSARMRHSMTYDRDRGAVLVFSGEASPLTGNLWAFDGTSWTLLPATGTPGAIEAGGMTWDDRRGTAVCFGGQLNHVALTDRTHDHDAGWVLRSPALSPSARQHAPLVYLAELTGVLVFGGWDGTGALDDFWRLRFHSQVPDEVCTGGIDDDGDGLIDCADPDCDLRPCVGGRCVAGACAPWENRCGDHVDDDGDGLIDCADPDCDLRPCVGGQCVAGACQ